MADDNEGQVHNDMGDDDLFTLQKRQRDSLAVVSVLRFSIFSRAEFRVQRRSARHYESAFGTSLSQVLSAR